MRTIIIPKGVKARVNRFHMVFAGSSGEVADVRIVASANDRNVQYYRRTFLALPTTALAELLTDGIDVVRVLHLARDVDAIFDPTAQYPER